MTSQDKATGFEIMKELIKALGYKGVSMIPMKTPKFKLKQIGNENQIVFEDDMPENLLIYLHENCRFRYYLTSAMVQMVVDKLIETGNLYQEEIEVQDNHGQITHETVWKCRIVV